MIKQIKEAWRPLLAITMILILFLYLVVGFFLTIFKITSPPLPDGAWALLSVFAGSYTLSRGAEQVATKWKQRNQYDDS